MFSRVQELAYRMPGGWKCLWGSSVMGRTAPVGAGEEEYPPGANILVRSRDLGLEGALHEGFRILVFGKLPRWERGSAAG